MVRDELTVAVPWLWLRSGSGRSCAVELRQEQQAVWLGITKVGWVLCHVGIAGICLAESKLDPRS